MTFNIFRNPKQLILLLLTFVGFVAVEYFTPKDIDWTPTFENDDKIPYGNYVLNEIAPKIFPNTKIENNHRSLYEYLENKQVRKSAFIFVTDHFNPDVLDLKLVLDLAKDGNTIFIAANDFSASIRDSLKFKVQYKWSLNDDSVCINFTNPALKAEKSYLSKKTFHTYFTDFDTLNTKVLGTSTEKEVDFVKIAYGKGAFLIHTSPYIYTNYNVLNNLEYVTKSFSYITENQIIIDNYYKPFSHKNAETPLRYILRQAPLKAAYWLIVIGFILYLFFAAKRQQRIIPIVKPPANTSLEFIQTIGRLYFHSGNHKDLIDKKFRYFSEFLRSKYYIDIKNEEENTIERIAEKTGVSTRTVQDLFTIYSYLSQKTSLDSQNILTLNEKMEDFYSQCK